MEHCKLYLSGQTSNLQESDRIKHAHYYENVEKLSSLIHLEMSQRKMFRCSHHWLQLLEGAFRWKLHLKNIRIIPLFTNLL